MQRKISVTSSGSNLITAATLMGMKLKQPRFVLPGLVPTGLTICAAKPKVGKSWWCLGLSVAVSSGSRFLDTKVAPGEVLYLALEDTLSRLKARLAKVCGVQTPSDSLYINAGEWNRVLCHPTSRAQPIEVEPVRLPWNRVARADGWS